MRNKPLIQGKRLSYYIKNDFPQVLLDWLNGQSDRNLTITYALERLFEEVGDQDIASMLPRSYVPLQASTDVRPVLDNTKIEILREEMFNEEESDVKETSIEEENMIVNKSEGRWESLDLSGDPYA